MIPESQLRLWQLISPALPIGSFAYSQGLEYAVETGWVKDEQQTYKWIQGQVNNTLSSLDIPVMQRIYNAWQEENYEDVVYWNQWILAAREAKELYDEDLQLGLALHRLLKGLDITLPIDDEVEWAYSTLFTFAAMKWKIPFVEAANGFLWAWCENQVAAAIKLVPLGQTSGQQVLSKILTDIPVAIEKALTLREEDIGVLAPGVGIASALHETQYSRLFRS